MAAEVGVFYAFSYFIFILGFTNLLQMDQLLPEVHRSELK